MEGIYTFGLRVIFPEGADVHKETQLVKECLKVHRVPVIDEDYFERGATLKIPYSDIMVDYVLMLTNGTLYNTQHALLQFYGDIMPKKFLNAPIIGTLKPKDLPPDDHIDSATA